MPYPNDLVREVKLLEHVKQEMEYLDTERDSENGEKVEKFLKTLVKWGKEIGDGKKFNDLMKCLKGFTKSEYFGDADVPTTHKFPNMVKELENIFKSYGKKDETRYLDQVLNSMLDALKVYCDTKKDKGKETIQRKIRMCRLMAATIYEVLGKLPPELRAPVDREAELNRALEKFRDAVDKNTALSSDVIEVIANAVLKDGVKFDVTPIQYIIKSVYQKPTLPSNVEDILSKFFGYDYPFNKVSNKHGLSDLYTLFACCQKPNKPGECSYRLYEFLSKLDDEWYYRNPDKILPLLGEKCMLDKSRLAALSNTGPFKLPSVY